MTHVATSCPRLGFVGVGWIGRSRMDALVESGAGRAAAVADTDAELRESAASGGAAACASVDELLEHELDGVVIATPSALHAQQAVAALRRGLPVFCQKPLGRDAHETAEVVDAAREANLLLGVDLSYRFSAAVQAVRRALEEGALGRVYAADLTFHNAYGPDKPWFTQRELSGGGCLVDLGIHLADLALWLLGARDASVRSARLLRRGEPLPSGDPSAVEDFALAELELEGDVVARLACSWWLAAGRDCVLDVTLYGSDGAASIRDVGGSFYDFRAELHRGTTSVTLAQPPDDWGGRTLVDWTRRVASDASFDASAEELVRVAKVLDDVYEAAR
jgi:predicted dehydrogenase